MVNSLMKRPHFIPTNTTVSSEGAARLYYQHVWKLHGLPLEWLHDRGSVFISEFMKELNRLLGIKTSASTAYHIHASTQVTPFVADTGRNPRMGFEPNVDVADEDAEAFRDRMQEGTGGSEGSTRQGSGRVRAVLQSTTRPGSGL